MVRSKGVLVAVAEQALVRRESVGAD